MPEGPYLLSQYTFKNMTYNMPEGPYLLSQYSITISLLPIYMDMHLELKGLEGTYTYVNNKIDAQAGLELKFNVQVYQSTQTISFKQVLKVYILEFSCYVYPGLQAI